MRYVVSVLTLPCAAMLVLPLSASAAENGGTVGPVFFPYTYRYVPGIEAELTKLGYSPFTAIYSGIDLTKEPPYPADLEERLKKSGGGGVLWLTCRWPKEKAAEHRAKAIAILRGLAAVADKAGLRVALYPHTGDSIQTAREALTLVKEVAHPNVGLTLNLCHELRQGHVDALPQILNEVKGHLFIVTINGADRPPSGPCYWGWDRLIQPLGRGDFDVYGFLKSLKQIGYDGPFGLQCFGIQDPTLEHLAESMKTWRQYQERLTEEHTRGEPQYESR